MSQTWRNNTRFIADGEPVSAAVAGRPDRDLDGNVRYLRDRLDAADLGEATVAHGVTVSPDAKVGMPVYYRASAGRFEPALADIAAESSGALVLAESAFVRGIVLSKGGETLADLLLGGRAPVDLTESAGSSSPPGQYYLSSAAAGRLVAQEPAVSVPVLYLDGDGYAYVEPQVRDFLAQHVHYNIPLACVPAGQTSPPSVGQRHAITSPDATRRGWLPASHPSFAGAAPAGAAFGYNIAADPPLSRGWPPIPAQAACLVFDRGETAAGGTFVPLGLNGQCAITDAGIWWMSDCYGDVPWPTDYNSASPPSPVPDNSGTPECPRLAEMRLNLAYAAGVFATKGSVVTQLRSNSDAIRVLDADGNPAVSKNLYLDFQPDFMVNPDDVAGGRALKTFSDGQFSKGWMVEGLRLGGGLLASGEHVDATDPANPIYQGLVTLSLPPAGSTGELQPQIVRVADAEVRTYQSVAYLAFPAARSSAVYFQFAIPPNGLAASPTITLRLLLLGTATGTLPAISASYRRLPWTTSSAQVAFPTADTALTLATGQGIAANHYLGFASSAFAVAAGDTVLLSLSRAAGDGYGGDVGILRVGALLGGV